MSKGLGLGPFTQGNDPGGRLRFQAQLLDSVRESIVATDLSGRVVFWSRGAERLYRISAEETLGRNIESIIVSPVEEDDERQRMQEVLKTGSWSGEYEQRRADGTRFWADTSISLVTDSDGQPIGYIGIDRDITDRKEVEKALQESQERLLLALEASGASFWDWDIVSGEVYFSPQWKESLGFAADEVPGRIEFWEEVVHHEDWPRTQEELAAHLAGRTEFYECENRLRSASGKWRWNLDRGRVVERDAEGRPLRMVGTDTDIGSRREAEQRLREMQRLESLGVLAGGIAHDFNNLLAVILGNIELALMELPTEPKVLARIEEVGVAARRAGELTRELLVYAGRSRPVTEILDLSAVVTEMARLLGTASSPHAEMELDLAPDLPSIEADPGQLRQVLMNLITNAAEAIDGGEGRILLRTSVTRVDGRDLPNLHPAGGLAEGEYVSLEVEDSGQGMDEETKRRIFEPFFSTKFDGRGLGLASMLGIVRAHGGALAVESTPGAGTSFRILLPPAARPRSDVREPREETASSLQNRTVLVVDDEEAVRRVTGLQLTSRGCSVRMARNGPEAIEELRQRPHEIDAVVLDLVMPGLGGGETLSELRKLRGDLPVVLASGYDASSDVLGLAKIGRVAVLQKPYGGRELISTLQRLLANR